MGKVHLVTAGWAMAAAQTGWAQMNIPVPTSPSAMAPSSAYQGASEPSTPSIGATKRADPGPLGGRWYGVVELRHHLNTYYDDQGGLSHQEPSMHARMQIGATFYDGMVDAYATLGMFKEAHSEQVLQRRPELALDLYPVKNQYFTLLQYNLIQFPVAEANSGINDDTDADDKDDYSSSTTYLIGLAPQVKLPLAIGSARLELKAGLDGWTKLYSRKQYIQDTGNTQNPDTGDETDQGRLELTGSSANTANPNQPIEDYALHYEDQAMVGFTLSQFGVKGLSFETAAYYDSKFTPLYKQDAIGNVSYTYQTERYAYYRIRLHYDLNDRLSLTNDFYQFHEGFFAANRYGDDERRFRNIARLTCKL